jgi:hypothetical protein
MEHYKIIVLIIDSDNSEIYENFRSIIRKYTKLSTNIMSFFIRLDNNIENDVKLENDTLYFKGTESYIPGVLYKTCEAFKYCINNYSFDYILRTNLSSFYNYSMLSNKISQLPKTNVVFAVIGYYDDIMFPSGAGFLMSHDVIDLCINNIDFKDKFYFLYEDDVCIGMLLKNLKIQILNAERCDYITQNKQYNPENTKLYYHFRVKSNDRINYDSKIFELLYDDIYGNDKL